MQRLGDWSQTFTGGKFYALDPRPEDVCIEDIAHHLALLCRFCGACRGFYSVAQHSVLVSLYCAPEHALWGLLHDASEAYVGDMMRALKHSPEMVAYRVAEQAVQLVICRRFGLPIEEPEDVKRTDSKLLFTEARDLMTHPPNVWKHQMDPLPEPIRPWSWEYAEQRFLNRFHELSR